MNENLKNILATTSSQSTATMTRTDMEPRDIQGFEGRYQVTSDGRVYSLISRRPGPISLTTDNWGYKTCKLHAADGTVKKCLVHRLVALAFLGAPPPGKTEVNHLNEDTTDNRIENLEWTDHRANIRYGTGNERRSSATKNKPKPRRVVLIIDPTTQAVRRVKSIHEASRVTGVNVISVWRGCHGLRHCSSGLVFRFADASEWRCSRGSCYLPDKDGRTYPCDDTNCPFIYSTNNPNN